MELKISLNKNFCTPKDVALVIWQNMILAKELEFNYQTERIGDDVTFYSSNDKIDSIKKFVCSYYNIPVSDLPSKSRKRELVFARQVGHFFSKRFVKASLATIGNKIGEKDHSTVLHSSKTIWNLYDTDRTIRAQIDYMEGKIKSKLNIS